MNEELLKHLLTKKISLVHEVVGRLPESVQNPVKDLEKKMTKVLYDICKDNLEKSSVGEDAKHEGGLKVIEVE